VFGDVDAASTGGAEGRGRRPKSGKGDNAAVGSMVGKEFFGKDDRNQPIPATKKYTREEKLRAAGSRIKC
jgi:hypothetical protein